MAIAEDGTTPALTFSKSATSVTSPSFSPPSGSLLVAIASYSDYNQSGDGNNATLTISDSGGHTWTAGPNSVHSFGGGADHLGSFMAYTYLSSAPGTITVKFQQNKVACDMQLDVRVVTGAASSQTGAASVSGNHQGSNPESTLTTTEVGSWVYTAAVQFEYATTFTALANTTTIHSSIDSTSPSAGNGPNTLLTGRVTNATTTPGSLTIGWTNSPSAATYQTWLALEILPAGSPTTVNLTTARVNVTALAPVVNIGGKVVNLLTAQVNVAALVPTVTHSQITSGGPGTAGNIKLTYISAQTQALTYSISPIAGFDPYGNQIPAGYQGPLSAIQPGTAPAVTETWHSLDLTVAGNSVASGNGANGFWYRYRGDNEVELLWDLNLTSATPSPILATLPLGYWPAVPQNLLSGWYGTGPGAYSTTFSPHMSVSTLGVLTAVNCNSLTTVSLAGRAKMTLDTP